MTDETQQLIARLESEDHAVVQKAAEDASQQLAGADTTGAAQIAEALLVCASHAKWQVRRAIANAALQIKDAHSFAKLMAVLEQDDNAFVLSAVKRVLRRRTDQQRMALLDHGYDQQMDAWLAGIEAKYGAEAQKACRQVAQRYANLLMRGLRHELVSVVSVLDGSLAALGRELESEKVDRERCSDRVQTAKGRAAFLHAVLISLTDITADVQPDFHVEQLGDIALEVGRLIEDASGTGVHVEVKGEATASVHRHRFEQALRNVVQNAVEAYPDNAAERTVTVRVTEQDSAALVEVSDQGRGIDPEDIPDITRMFVSGKRDGTGFGLALTKQIIEAEHGGRLEIQSWVGEGTTVILRVPLQREDHAD